MNVQRPLLISLGLVSAMGAVSAWAWPRTPASVAVHFGMDGAPDRFGSRAEALLMLPALALAITVVMAALPQVMPKASKLERSRSPYVVSWIGAVALMTLIHGAITARAVGLEVDIARVAFGLVGGLLIVLGNVMGKARYNYVVGVRTPWTLSSEQVWDRTHRLAGPWMMIGGALIVLAALLLPATPEGHVMMLAVTLLGAMGPAVLSVVYSYWVSRRLGDV